MVHLQYWRSWIFFREIQNSVAPLTMEIDKSSVKCFCFLQAGLLNPVRYLVLQLEDKLKIFKFWIFRWYVAPSILK